MLTNLARNRTIALLLSASLAASAHGAIAAGPEKLDSLEFFTLPLPPSAPKPSTAGKSLSEIYALARQRAESVAIQEELLNQAEETRSQAKSAMLPTITGTATFLRQETPTNATGSVISPASQSLVRISGTQPLFRGFRDFAALRRTGDLVGAQKFAVLNASRQLFYDTAAAYYNVLALTSDEFNYRNEIEINRKRLKDLEGFVRIGRSQGTDVLTLKTNISALEANLEMTHGQLETAKDTLAYFSGLDRETPLRDQEPAAPRAEAIATYLEAIEKRPDVQTALANVQANEEGIPIAWGQHLPSADLTGNYYLERPGALKGVQWDLQLALTLPIFQSGAILSQTRQASSVYRQFNLLLSQARRQAEQEIRSFYDTFTAGQRQIAKLAEASDLARKNYEAQSREYRNGLVTNLDVLQTITSWQAAQRTLSRSQLTARLDYVRLQAATARRAELEAK